MDLWGTTLTNSSVVLHSDNNAVVDIINSNTSKDPYLISWWLLLLKISSLVQSTYQAFTIQQLTVQSTYQAFTIQQLTSCLIIDLPLLDTVPSDGQQELSNPSSSTAALKGLQIGKFPAHYLQIH